MEKEFIIIMMKKGMKVTGKMIENKGKGFSIIIMEIEKWEIL